MNLVDATVLYFRKEMRLNSSLTEVTVCLILAFSVLMLCRGVWYLNFFWSFLF